MNDEAIDNRQDSFHAPGATRAVRRLQLGRAGSSHFGIFTAEIATIVSWREPTPLPHAPQSVLGLVSLQGRMLTVLDLASLLTGETVSSEARAQHLIALRGDEQLALAVEDIDTTIEISDDDFEDKPETAGAHIIGVLHREGLDIQVLKSNELFSSAIQGRERRRRRFQGELHR